MIRLVYVLFFNVLVPLVFIFILSFFLIQLYQDQKLKDKNEGFESIVDHWSNKDRQSNSLNRHEISYTTFPYFQFYANKPGGFVQIGRFLLQWGSGDKSLHFPKRFTQSLGLVAIPTRSKGGNHCVKVKNIYNGYAKMWANGCERPMDFLAYGYNDNIEKDNVNFITVPNFNNKPENLKYIASRNTVKYNKSVGSKGSCGGC
jgi:hypothetical protein